MNFSDIFIRRPIATSLMMLAVALFGLVAYRALPVSDLPNVDFPTLVVSASLPGANPDTMASAVATPLERQFSIIAGLDTMRSEEHTSELQSLRHLVCRLLLEMIRRPPRSTLFPYTTSSDLALIPIRWPRR